MQRAFDTPNQREQLVMRDMKQLRGGGAEETYTIIITIVYRSRSLSTQILQATVHVQLNSRHVSWICDELARLSPLTFAISTAFDSLW